MIWKHRYNRLVGLHRNKCAHVFFTRMVFIQAGKLPEDFEFNYDQKFEEHNLDMGNGVNITELREKCF